MTQLEDRITNLENFLIVNDVVGGPLPEQMTLSYEGVEDPATSSFKRGQATCTVCYPEAVPSPGAEDKCSCDDGCCSDCDLDESRTTEDVVEEYTVSALTAALEALTNIADGAYPVETRIAASDTILGFLVSLCS